MIKANSFLELENLFSDLVKKKAVRTNPLIIVNEYDAEKGTAEVEVLGSKPYTLIFGVNPEGENFIACTCRGALEKGNCYHGFCAFLKVRYLFKPEIANQANTAQRNGITEHNQSPYLKESKGENRKLGEVRY